jgi:hypothetical protein
MQTTAPRVAIGAGSIERAAATARPTTLFAHRFEAFRQANERFVQATKMEHAEDEVCDALCQDAGEAYRNFISTPAPDHVAISLKISTLVDWHAGTQAPLDVVNSIGAEACALLAKEA